MAASHGSKAKFRVTDAGAVLRDLSAYLTDVGMPRSADTAEVSTLGSTSKSYIPGLKDGTIPLSGPYDPVVDGYLNGLLGHDATAFEYDPQGATIGLFRYSGDCLLTSYEVATPVGGAATFSATFQLTGEVVRAAIIA